MGGRRPTGDGASVHRISSLQFGGLGLYAVRHLQFNEDSSRSVVRYSWQLSNGLGSERVGQSRCGAEEGLKGGEHQVSEQKEMALAGVGSAEAFRFHASRCDRVVKAVFARVVGNDSDRTLSRCNRSGVANFSDFPQASLNVAENEWRTSERLLVSERPERPCLLSPLCTCWAWRFMRAAKKSWAGKTAPFWIAELLDRRLLQVRIAGDCAGVVTGMFCVRTAAERFSEIDQFVQGQSPSKL